MGLMGFRVYRVQGLEFLGFQPSASQNFWKEGLGVWGLGLRGLGSRGVGVRVYGFRVYRVYGV